MAGGKLWGYVASGARALGGLGPLGWSGAQAGARLLKGVGGAGRPDQDGHGALLDGPAGRAGAGAPGRSGAGGMAGPQLLSRPELARLRWTDRAGGCVPDARHVQPADVVGRVLRGGGRAASVTVRLPVGLPVVVADATRLEAALAGLVDHAIRRTPPGGRVLVRADPLPGRDGRFGGNGGATGANGGAFDGVGAFGGAGAFAAGGTVGGPEAWDGEPARVELRVVDRGPAELLEARQWLLGGARGGAAGGGGAGGGQGGGAGGPAAGAGGPQRVGPSMAALVRAAGGRLTVEQTPGGGLTAVLVLAVARD
ncbi:hypothetical protein ACFCX4_04910 [Kitasatospora sp. NPDC056327]|uniref:hypothetical protein n=1 Tax=Kitasatospora sp. NPDC056327 TaxID=3345785 RepID=UPI0035E38BDE